MLGRYLFYYGHFRGKSRCGILWYPMVLGRIWQHIPFDVIERSSNGAVVVDLLGEGAGPR